MSGSFQSCTLEAQLKGNLPVTQAQHISLTINSSFLYTYLSYPSKSKYFYEDARNLISTFSTATALVSPATTWKEEKKKVKSLSLVQLFVTLWTVQSARLLHPWDFPGKNTGVGYHFLLQGIFPTQGLNLGLLHCRQTLYHLSHREALYCGPAIQHLAPTPDSLFTPLYFLPSSAVFFLIETREQL